MRGMVALFAVALACAVPASAFAEFTYPTSATPDDYSSYKLAPNAPRPNDLPGDREWMYASTPPSPTSPLVADKRELGGVRGAWVVDKDGSAPQAWATTT